MEKPTKLLPTKKLSHILISRNSQTLLPISMSSSSESVKRMLVLDFDCTTAEKHYFKETYFKRKVNTPVYFFGGESRVQKIKAFLMEMKEANIDLAISTAGFVIDVAHLLASVDLLSQFTFIHGYDKIDSDDPGEILNAYNIASTVVIDAKGRELDRWDVLTKSEFILGHFLGKKDRNKNYLPSNIVFADDSGDAKGEYSDPRRHGVTCIPMKKEQDGIGDKEMNAIRVAFGLPIPPL